MNQQEKMWAEAQFVVAAILSVGAAVTLFVTGDAFRDIVVPYMLGVMFGVLSQAVYCKFLEAVKKAGRRRR